MPLCGPILGQQIEGLNIGAFAIDDSKWPIILIEVPATFAKDDVDTYILGITAQFERARSCGIKLGGIVDARRIEPLKLKLEMITYLTSQFDKAAAGYAEILGGESIVADSPLIKGLITINYWLRFDAHFPRRCFGNLTDAMLWMKGVLSV